MEVNTNLTSAYTGNYHVSMNVPAETDAVSLPAMRTPQEARQAEINEKVMMDLKDVQNFLYMLIGSKLRVQDESSVPGRTFNMSA